MRFVWGMYDFCKMGNWHGIFLLIKSHIRKCSLSLCLSPPPPHHHHQLHSQSSLDHSPIFGSAVVIKQLLIGYRHQVWVLLSVPHQTLNRMTFLLPFLFIVLLLTVSKIWNSIYSQGYSPTSTVDRKAYIRLQGAPCIFRLFLSVWCISLQFFSNGTFILLCLDGSTMSGDIIVSAAWISGKMSFVSVKH